MSTITTQAQLWDMITAYRTSQIVRSFATFSVAEHLTAGRATAEEIARAESLDPDATFRLLRAGGSLGLVVSEDGRTFAATALLESLASDAPGSMRSLALALGAPGHWLPWGQLEEAIRTGDEQATASLGLPLWDYYAEHTGEANDFSQGLVGMTAAVGDAAAQVIDTRNTRLAVDVGGAGGSLLHDLMAVNPDLTGVVFDLPHIVPHAEAAAAGAGLADRVQAIGGDFFDAVPAADMYLLRYILHDWDDASCVRILHNCRRAMGDGGRLLVLEMIIGEIGGPALAPLQDIQMLVGLSGGRERTIDEFERLFDAAGLQLVDATDTGTPVTVLEARAA